MSSTYVHYSTPSSLPSDYALLARFAASRGLTDEHDPDAPEAEASNSEFDNDDSALAPSEEDTLLATPKTRRSSFPAPFVTPFNPTSMGALPDKSGHRSGPAAPNATENTPLLAPLVPRIPEEVDEEDLSPASADKPNVLWEEVKILTKYTLPVFG